MSSVVRKLKINKRFESTACGRCGDVLLLGEDGALCEACETPHHARCWDEGAGCGQKNCVNGPLPDLPDRDGTRQLRSDEKACPHCNQIIFVDADVCRYCKKSVSQDGLYHGEQTIAFEAKLGLCFGIAGFIPCVGVILGPLAFKYGWDAKKAIAAKPQLRGHDLATAAQVLGVVDVVLFVVLFAVGPASTTNEFAYWAGFLAVPTVFLILIVVLIRWYINRG